MIEDLTDRAHGGGVVRGVLYRVSQPQPASGHRLLPDLEETFMTATMIPTRGAGGATTTLAGAALLATLLSVPAPAAADAVTDWSVVADQTSVVAHPSIRAYYTAIPHLAIHDALNSIDARYASYTGVSPVSPSASPEAAIAAAAYVTLSQLVPSQAGALNTIYANRIAELPPCPPAHPTCIQDGVAAGEAAAFAILALRAGDGSATPSLPYTLPPGPGVYEPTPPAFAPPLFAGWANLTPFALTFGGQFRSDPGDLFDLTGEAYTRNYDEVKRVGAANAEALGHRTADESEIARFWPSGGANWSAVTRVIAAGRGLDLWEHARLFALLNMAISDSSVSVFETKYTYNFWRPITAIRAGGTDGNPATEPDADWQPYLPTPPYPDYTCGLTTNTGAAVEVLRRYFGTDQLPYTFTAFDVFIVPGQAMTRSYESLSQAAAESVDARVYGGMHFREGCEKGVRQGERVGRFVIQHYLKSLKGKHD